MIFIQALRAIIFYIFYWSSLFVIGIISLFLGPFPFATRYKIITYWNKYALWSGKFFTGVDFRVIGLENIPCDTNYVVLCKHQSAWETIFTQVYFQPICTILKKELLRIPFFGWGLSRLDPIAIDRANPRAAMKQVHSEGIERIKRGVNLLVFPEGTRTVPGAVGTYARGGAEIACVTGVPVLPVAHNAGLFWPVSSILKKPGTITVIIGKPISTLNRNSKELTEEVRHWIEDQLLKLPLP